jgi:hypothetical protein
MAKMPFKSIGARSYTTNESGKAVYKNASATNVEIKGNSIIEIAADGCNAHKKCLLPYPGPTKEDSIPESFKIFWKGFENSPDLV